MLFSKKFSFIFFIFILLATLNIFEIFTFSKIKNTIKSTFIKKSAIEVNIHTEKKEKYNPCRNIKKHNIHRNKHYNNKYKCNWDLRRL